tara:strand:- start:2150 stop:2944 length:795 start_codon:yes stop_codon:yes gene_type:complete
MTDIKTKHFYDAYSNNESFKKRKESSIYFLRQRNNILKSIAIQHLVKKYKVKRVLDVGCGRGGDMFKYHNSGVETMVGIDFSTKRIQSAIERLTNMQNRPHKYQYYVHDMNDQFMSTDGVYDMISFVFSIHYAKDLSNTLSMYTKLLKTGGCVLIIYMNYQKVMEMGFKSNSICNIRELNDDEISFTLSENVENCTEKKMTPDLMHGSIPDDMDIVLDINFSDFLKTYGEKSMLYKIKRNEECITSDELTVSDFYHVLVIEKQN